MFYDFQNSWGWLLAAFIVGLIVGWLTWSGARRSGWFDGWAKWGAAIFVAALAIAFLRLFPGRAGFWVETALWFTASYIVGCFLGGWLRAALGMEAPAATTAPPRAMAAAALVSPSVEIFGQDTSGAYPGARPPDLAAPKGRADDLKLISGMGPLNEKFCNAIGVYHYSQIAGWTPDHRKWFDHHLSRAGFVAAEKWVEQAKSLAAGKDTDYSAAAKAGRVAPGVGLLDAPVGGAGAQTRAQAAEAKELSADAMRNERARQASYEAERQAAIRAAADKAEGQRADALQQGAKTAQAERESAIRASADKAVAVRSGNAAAATGAVGLVDAGANDAQRLSAVRGEAERAEAARLAAAQAAQQAALKAVAERAEVARSVAAKVGTDRQAAAKAESERVQAAQLATARVEAERVEAARAADAKTAADADPAAKPAALILAAGENGDDLKLIKGIGPMNERICNALGVHTFKQIAEWSPDNAAWVGNHLKFPGRIEREHWIPQARLLAAGVDTDHSAGVKSGLIKIDESADAPLSATDAADLRQGLPQVAIGVEGEDTHAGSRPLGLAAPRGGKADDLKRVRGIGKQNEARLHGLGIWHFDQIAGWTEENVKWAGSYLAFPGRIDREHWILQAKDLAAGRETDFSKRVAAGLVPTSADDGTRGQSNVASAALEK